MSSLPAGGVLASVMPTVMPVGGRVPDRDQGLAGALLNTLMQIGGAVVLALVTSVVEAGQRAEQGDPLAGHGPGTAVIVATVLVGLGGTLLIRHRTDSRNH